MILKRNKFQAYIGIRIKSVRFYISFIPTAKKEVT